MKHTPAANARPILLADMDRVDGERGVRLCEGINAGSAEAQASTIVFAASLARDADAWLNARPRT